MQTVDPGSNQRRRDAQQSLCSLVEHRPTLVGGELIGTRFIAQATGPCGSPSHAVSLALCEWSVRADR
jgi:hypothetical protein